MCVRMYMCVCLVLCVLVYVLCVCHDEWSTKSVLSEVATLRIIHTLTAHLTSHYVTLSHAACTHYTYHNEIRTPPVIEKTGTVCMH